MARTLTTIALIMLTLPMFANNKQDSPLQIPEVIQPKSTHPKDSIIINQRMIEIFNNSKYSVDNLSVNSLLGKCKFDDIKQAFGDNNLNTLDIKSVSERIEAVPSQ